MGWPVCEGCRHRILRYVRVRVEDYRGAREEYVMTYVCELGEDRDRNPYECPRKAPIEGGRSGRRAPQV
jgi:hypothetical protein